MDETADISRLPVDFEGSLDPGQLPEVTLGNHSLMATGEPNTPMVMKSNSGRLSPVRSRTMKEYDQQISDLMKENFNLKMRIYYMEERMQQRFGDGQDVFKTNIELQVEIGNLKKELLDKQVLVQKAALAMETLTAKQEQAEESLRGRLLAECKDDMNRLREDLKTSQQKCEQYQHEVSGMEKKIEAFKKDLAGARDELAASIKEREVLANKVERAEFGVQTLTGQLKLSEQAKHDKDKENVTLNQQLKDLREQLEDALKQTSRKERDIQSLSVLLEQSHEDRTSLLGPVHLQDEIEDQKEALKRKDQKVSELEAALKDKDDKIGKLEDALKDLENKKKDTEKALEGREGELKHKAKVLERYMKGVEDLAVKLHQLEIECKSLKDKLNEAEKERDKLQEALKAAELEKTQASNNLTSQLREANDSNRRLEHQLSEANDRAEDLIKSLGKKEGELAGFQDQLVKAMEALNKSEEAVEALQTQLKAERADFDNKLRDQALHFQITFDNKAGPNNDLELLKQQIADLQILIADQNVDIAALAREKGGLQDQLKERTTDFELLTSEHNRELASLEKDLTSLKAEVNTKDIKIQALENHRIWVEEQQRETVYRFKDGWSSGGGIQVQDFSLDLLQDIKMMMDLLRREIGSLASLRHLLGGLDKFGDGVSAELLLTEISSVQRIYDQLEKGVEKNHQLHQALLNSLRGEHRQSDSPDSNSCQDGGYNFTSASHQTKTVYTVHPTGIPETAPGATPTESGSLSSLENGLSHPATNHAVSHADNKIFPHLIDRSLQTGTSFSHIDQWVQTSLHAGSDENTEHFTGRDDKKRTSNLRQEGQKKAVGAGRQVSFLDVGDDSVHYYATNHHDSLTDDAKEDLGQYSELLEDYHNFRQGVLFDEDHFESRRHDRASSVKLDSRGVPSPGRVTDSDRSTPPSASSGDSSVSGSDNRARDSQSADEDSPKSHNTVAGNNTPVHNHGSDGPDVDEPDGNGHIPSSNTARTTNNYRNEDKLPNQHIPSANTVNTSQHVEFVKPGDYDALPGIGEGGDGGDITHVKTVVSSASSPDQNRVSTLVSSPKTGEVNQSPLGGKLGEVNQSPLGGKLDDVRRLKQAQNEKDDTEEWVDERGHRRSRRNSWAEELEQYRVHTDQTDHSNDRGNSTKQHSESHPCDKLHEPPDQLHSQLEQQRASSRSPKSDIITANMTSAELRDLVAQLQLDFIESRQQNRALGEQLDALSETRPDGRELENGNDKPLTNGRKSWMSSRSQYHKSHIPRPVASSTTHSTTSSTSVGGESTMSEGSDGAEPNCEQHKYALYGHPKLNGTTRGLANKEAPSVSDLSEAYNQIKMLERKLQATENTVRVLSKKNKACVSALEAAGVSTRLMKRSNSETSLIIMESPIGQRASSVGNLPACGSRIDSSQERMNHFISPRKNINRSNITSYPDTVESIERARSQFSHMFSQAGDGTYPSQPTFITATPSVSTIASSPEVKTGSSDMSASASLSSLQFHHSNYPQINNLDSPFATKNRSVEDNSPRTKQQSLASDAAKGPADVSMNISPDRNINQSRMSPRQSASQSHGASGRQGDTSQSQSGVSVSTSMLDQSAFPDVTYTSMMDNTMMNRLLTNLDHTMPVSREEPVTNLSVSQLQARVEHLERLNQALRHEVGVYEALEQSQGTQVSPSLSRQSVGTGVGEGSALTEDDLLRLHLQEIRKLRERLEKLDLTKDPEQLLIFQSHTYQRIVRQETVINQLKEEMQTKENQWHREMAEQRHKLSRERALLVEKLELDIADLQKTIKSQTTTIGEQDEQITELKKVLDLKEESERLKEEEMEKVVSDKAKLESNLLEKEKQSVALEKSLLNLEVEKKNYKSEGERMQNKLKDLEKDNEALKRSKSQLEEGSKCLKEIVAKRERALQEKVYAIKNLSEEKASVENKLREAEDYAKRLEKEIDKLKKEIRDALLELKEKAVQQADMEKMQVSMRSEKTKFESCIVDLTKEKSSIKSQLDTACAEKADLLKQIDELSQKATEKTSLERQITALKNEIKSLTGLEDEVQRLKSDLRHKTVEESELRRQLDSLRQTQSEVSYLREELSLSQSEVKRLKDELKQQEESGQTKDEEKKVLMDTLKEKEAKIKKREKQLSALCKKSDAVLIKLNYSLKEKEEQIKSLKRQKHLYEITLSCSSQEQKDKTMKELLEELMATRKQVDHLLSILEQNSTFLKPQADGLETYGFSRTTFTTDRTTTVTTSSSSDGNNDHPDTAQSSGAKDDSPESLFDEIGRISSDLEPELRSPSSAPNSRRGNQVPSPRTTHADQGSTQSSSPSKLQTRDNDMSLHTGYPGAQASIASDVRGLHAVLKLKAYEKLRTEAGQSLVILSGVEARVADRLRSYQAKSVTESMEYSTLREISMSNQNLRVCLEEAVKLVAGAWVLELPPVDARGHFFDPALAEQNENLKREVTRLQSRNDVLDHTVKEQQGRLNASETRHKQWEASLYKQLTKSTQDLEQAKENIDSSLYGFPPPQKHHSFRHPSPRKSPKKRFEDTI